MKPEGIPVNRSLLFYKYLSGILGLALIGLCSWMAIHQYQQTTAGFGPVIYDPAAPHAEEVRDFLKPLRYSAVEDFLRPEVAIRLNFSDRSWTLTNIHRFDQQGRVVIDRGRFGICGDLAAYAAWRVRLIFEDRYEIRYMRVSESNYFKSGVGEHYILRIRDTSLNEREGTFLLDPSLRRYGRPDLFNAYKPEEVLDKLPFVEKQQSEDTSNLGEGTPIHINRRAALMLLVLPVDGRFDRENYRITLVLTKRYEYIGRDIYTVQRNKGREEKFTDDKNIGSLFSKGMLEKLTTRMNAVFERLEFGD